VAEASQSAPEHFGVEYRANKLNLFPTNLFLRAWRIATNHLWNA